MRDATDDVIVELLCRKQCESLLMKTLKSEKPTVVQALAPAIDRLRADAAKRPGNNNAASAAAAIAAPVAAPAKPAAVVTNKKTIDLSGATSTAVAAPVKQPASKLAASSSSVSTAQSEILSAKDKRNNNKSLNWAVETAEASQVNELKSELAGWLGASLSMLYESLSDV